MHSLPPRCETAGTYDRAAHGHVRIHIANVVYKRAARQTRNESPRDAFDGGIRHGQNDVRRYGHGPWDGKRKILQIIRDTAAHLKAWISGRTLALDHQIPADFTTQEVPRMNLGWIVARPACNYSHAVIHREGFRDLRGEFSRGARVRRKIFV